VKARSRQVGIAEASATQAAAIEGAVSKHRVRHDSTDQIGTAKVGTAPIFQPRKTPSSPLQAPLRRDRRKSRGVEQRGRGRFHPTSQIGLHLASGNDCITLCEALYGSALGCCNTLPFECPSRGCLRLRLSRVAISCMGRLVPTRPPCGPSRPALRITPIRLASPRPAAARASSAARPRRAAASRARRGAATAARHRRGRRPRGRPTGSRWCPGAGPRRRS